MLKRLCSEDQKKSTVFNFEILEDVKEASGKEKLLEGYYLDLNDRV